MLRLSVLDKTISDLAAKRKKQEKLVQDLTAPMIELERLQREEAELEAAAARAKVELEQLEVERTSNAEDLVLFDAIAPDFAAWCRYQDGMLKITERGMCGGDARSVARVRAMGGTYIPEHADLLRSRLTSIIARQKELSQ